MHWDEKVEKNKDKRRTYKFLMSLTYFATSIVSLFVVKYLGEIIYLYAILGIIFSVGSALSAINPNLRNMYACILIYGLIALIISFYYNNHKIIFTIVDVILAGSSLTCIVEGVKNMRNGIDPDVIAAERQKEKKLKRIFKLPWLLFRFWW